MRHVVIRTVKESKPISEPVLWILISLTGAPRHGYALLRDIEASSNGRVRLSTGTLYGALSRLLEEGWIARFTQEDTSRDKQAYKLTATGHHQLRAELERMKQVGDAARARLQASGA